MEKNFKRLVIANGVLFAFAILATIIERVTVPDQLARAIQHLYGTPSSILGDFLVLVFYLLVYFYGLYSAYKFQSLGRLILTATVLFVFMDVDYGKHSLVGSMEGLFVHWKRPIIPTQICESSTLKKGLYYFHIIPCSY